MARCNGNNVTCNINHLLHSSTVVPKAYKHYEITQMILVHVFVVHLNNYLGYQITIVQVNEILA